MKSDTAAHEKRFVASKGCCASFAYEGEDKDEGEDEAESDDEYGDDDAVDALAGTINGCTNHRLMYLRVNIHMHDVEIRIGGASRI